MSNRDADEDVLQRFDVSRESRERLETYVKLLEQWQARINMIGPATRDDIWRRHIADALQILHYLPAGLRRLADLGSGAGIPGLILAIARPIEA